MAVSSQSNPTSNSVPGAPKRISFAKLREPLEVPGLLDVQTDSFKWLIGDPEWRQKAIAAGDPNPVGGLDEGLAGLSPIEDFSGSMSLSFSDPRLGEVKAPVDDYNASGLTWAAPVADEAEDTQDGDAENNRQ